MSLIFVDTSALIALGNKQDDLHDKAKNIRNALIQAHQSFITTNAILLELCNTFSALNLRNGAIQLVTAIRQSPTWYCVAIDPLMDAGIELFKQRPEIFLYCAGRMPSLFSRTDTESSEDQVLDETSTRH